MSFSLRWDGLLAIVVGVVLLASIKGMDAKWARLNLAGKNTREVWQVIGYIIACFCIVRGFRALFFG